MLEVAVITVSDRAFRGEYQDISGPTIVDIITESSIDANVSLTIVPDDKAQIRTAILQNIGKNYIITTGGTGISSRDITPDVTQEICDKAIPGVAEMLRLESYKQTQNAVFSRGYCGIRDGTIIINFPGSVEAVTLCTQLMLPIMEHGKKMLHGGKH
jgi:molybdenum cofactor synthesis domain-containing protein